MEKSTWILTLATQISLCFALFVALNIGRPQKPIYGSNRSERKPVDMYFLSVRGGSRPIKEQTHLLKLMEKVIKKYNARFVVNLSELGEDDPLLQNATLYLQLLKVPWYTTKALKENKVNYFVRQIEIPYSKVLDVIVLHTGSLQDSSSGNENDRLHWLRKPLQGSNSDWRIVVGFHPLVGCVENLEKMDLCHIFLQYGVDAYLSAESCTKYVHKEDMARIHNKSAMDRGPYFTSINEKWIFHSEVENGFLLHRVSSLEIVTYLVTLTGEVVHQTSLQQGGREVM